MKPRRMAVAGPLIALVLMTAIRPHGTAARTFSEWTAPTNLGCQVNSPFGEQGPAISKDGLSLYFGSLRPDGLGASDIWVSQRLSVDDPWGPPLNLGAGINSPAVEANIAADRLTLFFTSNRPGGCGAVDLYMTTRTKR